MMRLLDRYLVTLVVLLGLAGGLAYLPARVSPREATGTMTNLPMVMGEWAASPGAPSHILPDDPRARESIRWTFRNGDQVIWVTIGVYSSRNNPELRPSINYLVSEPRVSGIDRTVLPVRLDGEATRSRPVNHITVTIGSSRVAMLYWYQLGPTSIADEYRLRWALFLNTLLGRTERLALVRIATTAETGQETARPSAAEKFLQVFYPVLMKAVGN